MNSLLTKMKTHDILLGDIKLKLTGNAFLLSHAHGIVAETEIHYNDIEAEDGKIIKLNHESQEGIDSHFINYIVISLDILNKDKIWIKKDRPENFTSTKCDDKEDRLNDLVDAFSDKYKTQLETPKISHINTRGGITLAGGEGDLFDLNSSKRVTLNKHEVVKRLNLDESILRGMLISEVVAANFFDQIKEEFAELNCHNYTFKTPGGELFIRNPFSKYVEIRVYGLREDKDE